MLNGVTNSEEDKLEEVLNIRRKIKYLNNKKMS